MSATFTSANLGGGLTCLTEAVPGVRSVSIGVWIRAGSAHEHPEEMGVHHLLEHMVFKGTERRTAAELALVLERLGGSLDAYTTREHTCFQARVLDEHATLALEVLADLVLRPLLREQDLELEREVILEEIAAVEDTPDDLVFDLHAARLWDGHPYGFSILGNRDTVSSLQVADLRRVHQEQYCRSNLVVAAAGNLDPDRFSGEVAAAFAGAPQGAAVGEILVPDRPRPGEQRVVRPTAQTHVVAGAGTFAHGDDRRYGLILLSAAVGGGMSARLFQRLREELGLAYSVFSFQSFYRHGGVAGTYLGTRPETAERAVSELFRVLESISKEGLTVVELADAKGQIKGQLVLSLESTGTRLNRLAGARLYDEPLLDVNELLARIDGVSLDEVNDLAGEFFAPGNQTVLRLGPAL